MGAGAGAGDAGGCAAGAGGVGGRGHKGGAGGCAGEGGGVRGRGRARVRRAPPGVARRGPRAQGSRGGLAMQFERVLNDAPEVTSDFTFMDSK